MMRVYIARQDASILGVWYNLADAREALERWDFTLVHEPRPLGRYMSAWSREGLNGGPGDLEIAILNSHEVIGWPSAEVASVR